MPAIFCRHCTVFVPRLVGPTGSIIVSHELGPRWLTRLPLGLSRMEIGHEPESAQTPSDPGVSLRLSSAEKTLNIWADNAIEDSMTEIVLAHSSVSACKKSPYEVILRVYIDRAKVSFTSYYIPYRSG